MTQVRNTELSHITLQLGTQGKAKTGGGESTWMPRKENNIWMTTTAKRLHFYFCLTFPVSISFPFPAFPYALKLSTYVHLSFCYFTVTTVTCLGRELLRWCEMTGAYSLITWLKMVPPEIAWIVYRISHGTVLSHCLPETWYSLGTYYDDVRWQGHTL